MRVQAVAALRAALGIVAQRENQEELFYEVTSGDVVASVTSNDVASSITLTSVT